MPRTTANPVEQYLIAMRTAHSSGANTPETTFYTPLANLLNAVGSGSSQEFTSRLIPTAAAVSPMAASFPSARIGQYELLAGELAKRGSVEIQPLESSLAALAE